MTLTLGFVVAGLVFLLFAGFIWAMFQIAAWIGIATVALDLDDYRPANFVVSSVVYEPPTRRQPATYYARDLSTGNMKSDSRYRALCQKCARARNWRPTSVSGLSRSR